MTNVADMHAFHPDAQRGDDGTKQWCLDHKTEDFCEHIRWGTLYCTEYHEKCSAYPDKHCTCRKPRIAARGGNVKKMPLTREKYALVDNGDYEWLSQWKWHYSHYGYAARKSGQKQLYMHQVIMGKGPGMETDHINGNRLDNRRGNLRHCTAGQNQHNQRARKGKSSQYKGVYRRSDCKRWSAGIGVSGKVQYLGLFKSENDAARAYNEAARKHFGDFAALNSIKEE